VSDCVQTHTCQSIHQTFPPEVAYDTVITISARVLEASLQVYAMVSLQTDAWRVNTEWADGKQ